MDVRFWYQSARALLILAASAGFNACRPNPPSEASLSPAPPPTSPRFRRPLVAPKPPTPPDTRTQSQLEQAACTDSSGGWHCGTDVKRIVKFAGTAGGRTPPVNPAWTVPTVVLDPQNITTLASDDKSGLDATHPIRRWDEMNDARWICYGSPNDCPRTTNTMTVRFMSTQQTTDTFRFHPAMESPSNIIVQCDLPAASATGILAGVAVTTRANNAPPVVATLAPTTGSIATGQFVVDSTANAVFWIGNNDGGNVWELTPPYAPANLVTHGPTARVAIANGDSYSTYVQNVINSETIFPTGYQTNNSIIIDRCKLGADTNTTLTLGYNVDIEECDITSVTLARGPIMAAIPWAFNDEVRNGFLQIGDDTQFLATGYEFIGGQLLNGAYIMGDLKIDGDFSSAGSLNMSYGILGEIYLTSSGSVGIYGTVAANAGFAFTGASVIYGAGHVDVHGGGHLYYDTGTGLAAQTFPTSLGMTLYFGSSHLAVDTGVDPAVWHTRSSVGHQLVLDLDKTIAAGGYGMGATVGCAFGQGDTICNASP